MADDADSVVCDQCQYPLRGLVVSRVTGLRTCPECSTVEKVERLLPARSATYRNLVLFGPSAACSLVAMFAAASESMIAGMLAWVGMVLSLVGVLAAVDSILHRRVPIKAYPWRSFRLLLMGWVGSIAIFTVAIMTGVIVGRVIS